ncbi:PadR family transcriptional regulator [Brachybacterium hainanense]|uniref:PadR family transcriptional regulator n=1 Tax=Brachybacterium hainanense TaxID=1541174 RepID=A0ABV6R781_9MICO
MSATRLLVLGAIVQRGTAHGYRIRKDLDSWGAQLWGRIGQGSIYHALRRLEADGMIVADSPGEASGPARTRFSPTPEGSEHFRDLLERTLRSDEQDMASTMAGIGFMTTLPRARVITLLRERLAAQHRRRARVMDEHARHPGADWEHHIEAIRFWEQSADAAIAWTEGVVARLEAGEHAMADDEERPLLAD